MPEPTEAPSFVSKLLKAAPIIVGPFVAVAVSAFGWGAAWMSFQGRVDAIELRVVKLEADIAKPDLENRLVRIERLVGQLVCLDDRADKDLCRQALYGGR